MGWHAGGSRRFDEVSQLVGLNIFGLGAHIRIMTDKHANFLAGSFMKSTEVSRNLRLQSQIVLVHQFCQCLGRTVDLSS